MKINDIKRIDEKVIRVPQEWVNLLTRYALPSIQYAYLQEFSDYSNREEVAQEIGYIATHVDRDGDIENGNTIIINRDIQLSSDTDTISVILAASGKPGTPGGGFVAHETHGNLIIVGTKAYLHQSLYAGFDHEKAMNEIKVLLHETMEHELVHLIEHMIGDQRSLKQNSGYHTDRTEYLKSPVEFQAQLTSLIHEIKDKINNLSDEDKALLGGENIRNIIMYICGDLTKQVIPTGHRANDRRLDNLFFKLVDVRGREFMYTLKSEKPVAWKRAVKAIMDVYASDIYPRL